MSFYLTARGLMEKPLTISHLTQEFAKYGMQISNSWIRRQEEKGNLFVRKSTTNFKRPQGFLKPGAVRQFTPEDVKSILIAFLPKGTVLESGETATGRGYFNYEE